MSDQMAYQKDRTQQKASSLLNRILGQIDRIVPPQTRQQFFKNTQAFATEQPLAASFLTTQLLLAALPLLIFASFSLGTLAVSAIAAAAFSIFWIGTALLALAPTLFVTFSAGVFIWLWAVGTYIFCRTAYNIGAYLRRETREPRHKAMRTIRDEGERVGDTVSNLRDRVGEGISAAGEKVGSGVDSMQSHVRSAVNGARDIADDVKDTADGAMGKAGDIMDDVDEAGKRELASAVPDTVKRSFGRAQQPPEAAANDDSVDDKGQLEDELLNRVPKESSLGRQGLDGGSTNGSRKGNDQWYSDGVGGVGGFPQMKSPFSQQMATS